MAKISEGKLQKLKSCLDREKSKLAIILLNSIQSGEKTVDQLEKKVNGTYTRGDFDYTVKALHKGQFIMHDTIRINPKKLGKGYSLTRPVRNNYDEVIEYLKKPLELRQRGNC